DAVRGPMSRPIQPSGTSTPSSCITSVFASNSLPRTRSTGSTSSQDDTSARSRILRARSIISSYRSDSTKASRFISSVFTDAYPLHRKNAEAHGAADQDLVGGVEKPLDHAHLSAHLCAT